MWPDSVMNTLVIAPHPDDETLGCGGTLLRRKAEGVELGWLIVTGISEAGGWSRERMQQRDAEISRVAELIGFSQVFKLALPSAQLDQVPMRELIVKIADVFKSFQPEEVFVPHSSDVHSDHRWVFDAATACTKWFRSPSVTRVLAYETISETDFGLDQDRTFRPNYFVDISEFLDLKLEIMAVYESELGVFPFPRSIQAIRGLAMVRGATSGFTAAEAFQLLRERQ
jgi:N-acetylglucosamine malate deacetylase 1